MLHWAIQRIKGPIITLNNEKPALQKDMLTADEWRTLGYIHNFLQNFHDATKATEGRRATLDRVIPTMDFLATIFEEARKEFADHEFMRESFEAGLSKLLKYWNKTERSPAHIAAIVLDPTSK